MGKPTLNELWNTAPRAQSRLDPAQLARLPAPTRRYLAHAIAPGTKLASAVRLEMHGTIKLRRWLPFTAEQLIRWDRGMIWRATVRMYGLPVTGFDRLVDGEGAQLWKMLGLFPVMRASGERIARSAAGRLQAESVWVPSVLCGTDVIWSSSAANRASARVRVQGHYGDLQLTIDEGGRLQSLALQRFGDPDGTFGRFPFGGVVDEERTFEGYTIPSRLRVGWHFGSERFEREGEFFRATVDRATYR